MSSDMCTVLYQLTYQAIWEQDHWTVHYLPVADDLHHQVFFLPLKKSYNYKRINDSLH